jgi:hypothetical protein
MNTTEDVMLLSDTNYIPVRYRIVDITEASTAATTYCTIQVVAYGWDTPLDYRNSLQKAITWQNPAPTAPAASVNYYPGGIVGNLGGGSMAGAQGTLGALSVVELAQIQEYPIIAQKYAVMYNGNFPTAGVAPYDSSFYLPGATVTAKGNYGAGDAVYTRTDISFTGLVTYTRMDISFSSTDNSINTVSGNFLTAGFANGQTGITVSGSLYNNFNAFAGASIVTATATKLILTGVVITTELTNPVDSPWPAGGPGYVTITSGNEINTVAGNFLNAGFGPGQTGLTVSGSASNNITTGIIVAATAHQLILDPSTVLVTEAAGASDTLSTPLVAYGYTFGGWNTETDWKRGTLDAEPAGGVTYQPGGTFVMPMLNPDPQSSGTGLTFQGDVILWAVWVPIYTLTVNASPSNGGNTTGTGSVTLGAATPITATANAGWSFVNWTVYVQNNVDPQFSNGVIFAEQTAASTTVTLTDYALTNVTIQANFAQSYTVTYNGNGNTGGTVPATVSYFPGQMVFVSTNTGSLVRAGFTFSGWNTQPNGSGINYNPPTPPDSFIMGNPVVYQQSIVYIATNIVLYARWM